MILFFIIPILVLLIVAYVVMQKAGGGKFPWIQFYAKGKESGFVFSEVNLLRKVAVENRLEDPMSLFWSIKTLDRSIRGMITKFRAEARENDPGTNDFLSKLFDFRKRVEFNLPKYKMGLKSTKDIVNRQKIKITLPGAGTYNSAVVENLRRYIAVSYPKGPKLPPGFSWKNQKINIYFWRPEDAGYYFTTKVLDDFFDRKFPILHIMHSEQIIRSQKRRSIRVDVDISAKLYPLKQIQSADEEIETAQGLRCRLINLSEDGAALLIGGRAKVGLPIKMQFDVADHAVIMSGVVKGINFHQMKNQSILHIQAIPPSVKMKNSILTFVYNIFNERQEVKKKTM